MNGPIVIGSDGYATLRVNGGSDPTLFVTWRGERRSVMDLSRELGIPYPTLYQRVRSGWSGERLAEPARPRRRNG